MNKLNISIHAPHAGCDRRCAMRRYDLRHFNPRTPCGVRRVSSRSTARNSPYFNPRTPCGVRLSGQYRRLQAGRISIHAPHAGCDLGEKNERRITDISIHAPARGATQIDMYQNTATSISIHAPARGATPGGEERLRERDYFNPRTREGCDHEVVKDLSRIDVISIHAPARGATDLYYPVHASKRFQSTHPRGVRLAYCVTKEKEINFNPRTREGCDLHTASRKKKK